jgi:flagellar protein FlbT
MALKLTLKAGEKFVINGAVVINGDRRTNLIIQNKVSILREKDVMVPEDADTPVKRIYFAVMMMYLEPASQKRWYEEFTKRITEFMNAIKGEEALQSCIVIIEAVNAREYYAALVNCRKLLPFEKERLDYVASELSSNPADD